MCRIFIRVLLVDQMLWLVIWTGPNGFNSSAQSPLISANATTLMSGFTLTVTDSGNNKASESTTVKVNDIPASPVAIEDIVTALRLYSQHQQEHYYGGVTETTSSMTVTNCGICTATTTVNGCTSLPGSGIAAPQTSPASPLVSIDCRLGNGKSVVTVTTPTDRGLEYRLDGGLYQTGASFVNVPNGSHTITVRNASGCITTGSFFDVSCGCTNPSTVTLSSNSGSTCGITPAIVSGNTFGGSAVRVTLSDNGSGSVSPTLVPVHPLHFRTLLKMETQEELLQ